jgi:hypothetical protein
MRAGQSTGTAQGRRSRIRGVGAAVAVLALIPIGAAQAQTTPSARPSAAPDGHVSALDSPPPRVHLATSQVDLGLHPFASCWVRGDSGFCYDGPPPQPPPSLGGVLGAVNLSFARDGWHFKVSVIDSSGHRTKVTLNQQSERVWRLALGQLPDDDYRVDIFGKGPQGDVLAAAALTLN